MQQKAPAICLLKTLGNDNRGVAFLKNKIKNKYIDGLTPYNEADLIRELASGSSTSFDSIYKRYYEAVRANIFRILRDEDATDDILQEVFISLWEKRAQFAGSDKISGWLFVASYNRSMNALRRITTERVYKRSMENTRESIYMEEPGAAELQEQQFLLLEAAIANLPPQRKKVFELCRFQGKTYEQTAAELSISRNTVKEHLQKAAESIRNYILSHPGDPMLVASLAMLFLSADL